MIKTYPEDVVVRKMKRLWRALFVVLVPIVAGFCYFISPKMDSIFLGALLGLMSVVTICSLWLTFRILRDFRWCGASVLEIEDGQVVAYHKDPFAYKPKGSVAQLVTLSVDPITVKRIFRWPMNGDILTCVVECVAVPKVMQKFYDAFLRPEVRTKSGTAPKDLMHGRIDEFLLKNQKRFVELREGYDGPADQCNEYMGLIIQRRVEDHFYDDLRTYGLFLQEVRIKWCAFPFDIE